MEGDTPAREQGGRGDRRRRSAALERRVLRYVRDEAVLRPGERVLAAVSGGPDSTALVVLLSHLAPKLDLTVVAAHFDHGLRGRAAARRERSHVEYLCRRLEVPLRLGEGDTRAHARSGRLSFEEAARELRYGFLAEAGADAGCTVVATGHTASDQVETVLLHLIRGSGLAGLAGMAPRAPWPLTGRNGPEVGRPLLCLGRQETADYCQSQGLDPVDDPTNVSPRFLRNRVRLELLPLLRQYNPRIDSALLRMADAARADLAVLEGMASDALVSDGGGQAVILSRSRLKELPKGLQRHALRLAVRRLLGDTRDLEKDHIEALIAGLAGEPGHHLDLPRGLRFDMGYEEATLALSQAEGSGSPEPAGPGSAPPAEARLAVPGLTRWGEWQVEVATADLSGTVEGAQTPPANPWQAWLDADAVGEDLWVRSRRPGDRFQPLGMAGEKKLQDFFVDARVPRAERDAVPLVCGNPGIVWVVGYRIDERARVTEATRRTLRLRFQRPGDRPRDLSGQQ